MSEAIIFIVVLFFVGLVLKKKFSGICAVCFAVFLTWLYGLVVGWDTTVLAVLMGGSAVGFMYYLGTKFPSWFGLFKLPYLITAFSLIYVILERDFNQTLVLVLVGVWIIFVTIYFLRNGRGAKWFRQVVECCKNW